MVNVVKASSSSSTKNKAEVISQQKRENVVTLPKSQTTTTTSSLTKDNNSNELSCRDSGVVISCGAVGLPTSVSSSLSTYSSSNSSSPSSSQTSFLATTLTSTATTQHQATSNYCTHLNLNESASLSCSTKTNKSFIQHSNFSSNSSCISKELEQNSFIADCNRILLKMPLSNTPCNMSVLASTATAVNNSMIFKSSLRAKKVSFILSLLILLLMKMLFFKLNYFN